jgi:hypothetical protein
VLDDDVAVADTLTVRDPDVDDVVVAAGVCVMEAEAVIVTVADDVADDVVVADDDHDTDVDGVVVRLGENDIVDEPVTDALGVPVVDDDIDKVIDGVAGADIDVVADKDIDIVGRAVGVADGGAEEENVAVTVVDGDRDRVVVGGHCCQHDRAANPVSGALPNSVGSLWT